MVFTDPGRDFHHAPGVVAPLPDDEIQLVIPQTVLENILDGWTQMFQDEPGDGRTARAITETHLWREGRNTTRVRLSAERRYVTEQDGSNICLARFHRESTLSWATHLFVRVSAAAEMSHDQIHRPAHSPQQTWRRRNKFGLS